MRNAEEIHPFPLLALVGQPELKTALLVALINPQVGGVLLSGPYGVGKTTAVRGLLDVMPLVEREHWDDEGTLHVETSPMRLIELPLNARLEDVVGGMNERVALEQQRVFLEDGILARAHQNLLYVDEINLLDARVIDAILDAAAQGRTLVRRGPLIRLYPTRFVLVGSMNPEEGTLRPQIMDRFGLRVWVSPLEGADQRLEVYRRARLFQSDPQAFRSAYAADTEQLREEVAVAREILPHVVIPPAIETLALMLIQELQIPSHRAEIALLEGARARAAADFRGQVGIEDIERIAPLALRQRRSPAIEEFAAQVERENALVGETLQRVRQASTLATPAAPSPSPPVEPDTPPEPHQPGEGRRSQMRRLEDT